MRRTALAVALAAFAAGAAPAAADAHQTTVSNGIAVTVHVIPDDEPVAGQRSTIQLVRARRRGWRFSYRTCGCRLVVSDSSGGVVLNRSVRTRSTPFTFPRRGAYRIRVSGRLTRGRRSKRFNASFTIRAN